MKKLLLIILIKLSIFANSDDTVTLQFQWKHQFEFAGFYMAKEKGFYKEFGINVEFVEYSPEINIINKVLSSKNMYGISYSNIITEYMQGKPIVYVANFFKQSPLAIATSENITLPSDLIGKKVMGVGDGINSAIVLVMFKKFGIAKDDFIHIPASFKIDEFVNHEVDAMAVYTTNETYFLDKLGIKYNLLNPTVFGAEFYDLNLFTSQEELRNNPQRVQNFKEASIKGWEYALKHKDEVIRLIKSKYNTQNKSYESLEYEALQVENIMLPKIYPIGSIDKNRVQLMIDDFKNLGLLKSDKKVDLDDFIYKTPDTMIYLSIKTVKIILISFSIFMILLIILWNIKLKRKVATEIQKNKEQETLLYHYGKQKSMQNMLGNISHQWRHPLSELSSNLMLIDTKLSLDQEITKDNLITMTNDSKEIISFMSKSIDTFTNFYTISNELKESFLVEDAINRTLFILQGSLQTNNIVIKKNIQSSISMYGNINHLEQVLLSIYVNAKDVLIQRQIHEPCIYTDVYTTDSEIYINISDNANGIQEIFLKDIFNLSFSKKNDGTGLGLFIAKNIITTKLGGKIEVKNGIIGAEFSIILNK